MLRRHSPICYAIIFLLGLHMPTWYKAIEIYYSTSTIEIRNTTHFNDSSSYIMHYIRDHMLDDVIEVGDNVTYHVSDKREDHVVNEIRDNDIKSRVDGHVHLENKMAVDHVTDFRVQGHLDAQEVHHVVLVSCGTSETRLVDLFVTVKSILLMQSDIPLTLHIFMSEQMRSRIDTFMDTFPESAIEHLSYHFYEPQFPSEHWRNMFRECSTQRLFIPDLLPKNVSRILYLDTDCIVLAPLHKIWSEFDSFRESEFIGLTYRKNFQTRTPGDIPFLPPNGFNAGVMLLDIDRIRKDHWIKNLTAIMERQVGEGVNKFGDQDILDEYLFYNPERLHVVRYCTMDIFSCVSFRK